MCKATKVDAAPNAYSLKSLFWTKGAYKQVESEFHPYHKHDLNVFAHLWTTGLGVWGAVQLAVMYEYSAAVYAYGGLVLLTCPHLVTNVIHTAMIAVMMKYPLTVVPYLTDYLEEPWQYCLLAIALGYGLQDVAHWLFCEKTYLGDYITTRPYMLIPHSLWLLPLVIDAMNMRKWFVPHLFVSRNRNVVCDVSDQTKKSVDFFRKWISENVPSECKVTTHVWPHRNGKELSDACVALEKDSSIMANFRKVFAAKHYDVLPVQDMNEIYVTAVGAKKDINSDAVFYTKHNDGPYWWLPCASLYRVLVGVTHNEMVRTNFNLQHESQNQVLDLYGVVGFDYNRELHWIDHVPGKANKERRSLVKLHFIVYPKGWHRYGQFCAKLNTNYNTWARNNFLQTLKIDSFYDWALAWWIWLVTIFNATFEEKVGWPNAIYVGGAFLLGGCSLTSNIFLISTSFRHYMIYMTTFAYRQPMVAHGFFVRDALLYKTLAIIQLVFRLIPLIDYKSIEDMVTVALVMAGYSITMLATARLGFVRTYFGSELGFVKPKWITGFPYGYIPHPMIVGQLISYSTLMCSPSFANKMPFETKCLVATHMVFYCAHMVQEMLTSSY